MANSACTSHHWLLTMRMCLRGASSSRLDTRLSFLATGRARPAAAWCGLCACPYPRSGWGHVTSAQSVVLSFRGTLTPPHHSRGTHKREKILVVSFKTFAEMDAFEKYAHAKALERGGVSLEQPLKDACKNSGLENLDGFTEVFMLSGDRYEHIQQLFRDEAVIRVAAEESKASFADIVRFTTRELLKINKMYPSAAMVDLFAVFAGCASRNEVFCKCLSGCLALFLRGSHI